MWGGGGGVTEPTQESLHANDASILIWSCSIHFFHFFSSFAKRSAALSSSLWIVCDLSGATFDLAMTIYSCRDSSIHVGSSQVDDSSKCSFRCITEACFTTLTTEFKTTLADCKRSYLVVFCSPSTPRHFSAMSSGICLSQPTLSCHNH